MAKFDKKIKAHKLRKKGLSLGSIATKLEVSKSTVSLWCRDLPLTKKQQRRIEENQISAGNRGRMIGAEMNKQKRLDNIKRQEAEAKEIIGSLTERDKLFLGIGLYWGEGAKSNGDPASLINSDPELLLLARDWFEILGVDRKDFNPYIFISESHSSREDKILSFWSKKLDIPKSQFHKMILLKNRPKKMYKNHDSYYGTVALRVRKSVSLKYKILGLIKYAKDTRKIK